jgi:hypothetical protein
MSPTSYAAVLGSLAVTERRTIAERENFACGGAVGLAKRFGEYLEVERNREGGLDSEDSLAGVNVERMLAANLEKAVDVVGNDETRMQAV